MHNFRKIKKNTIIILQRNSKSSVNTQIVEYYKVNVKLSDSQLNKLKSAFTNQTGVTLGMNIKNLNGNNLPHVLI